MASQVSLDHSFHTPVLALLSSGHSSLKQLSADSNYGLRLSFDSSIPLTDMRPTTELSAKSPDVPSHSGDKGGRS